MESQYVEEVDSFLDIDRMINERLGGGYIDRPYKAKQLEPIEEDLDSIKRRVD